MKASLSLLLVTVCLVGLVHAETWYISPYGKQGNNGTTPETPFLSLSAALSAATSGDTISAANGVYTGSDNIGLDITEDITIEGKSESSTIFQDTDGDNGFNLKATVAFSKLTIVGMQSQSYVGINADYSGSGVVVHDVTFQSVSSGISLSPYGSCAIITGATFDSSVSYGVYLGADSSYAATLPSLSISDSLFQSSYAGIYLQMYPTATMDTEEINVSGCVFQNSNFYLKDALGPQSLVIEDCQFSNYEGSLSAIYVNSDAPNIVLEEVSVSHTSTSSNAAIYLSSQTSTFTPKAALNDCWLAFNHANGYPAGLSTTNVDVTLNSCGFVGNSGEAFYARPGSSASARVTMSDNIFFANDARNTDSAAVNLYSFDGLSTCSDSVFIGNRGYNGGAMYVQQMAMDISGSYFYENEANMDGGALYSYNGANVTFSYSTFSGNSAQNGGAVSANYDAGIGFTSCSFLGNNATENGGGFFAEDSSRATLLLSSFASNSAGQTGGGWGSSSSSVNGNGVLLRSNSASTSGGGFACSSNGVSLLNGFITGNMAPVGAAYACEDGCNTFLTNVHVSTNNDASGCGNDDIEEPLEDVRAAVERAVSVLPELDMQYILALVDERTGSR